MNKQKPNKPEELKQSASSQEIGKWLEQETKYRLHCFLEEKEKLGDEVEYSPEEVLFLMKIQKEVIGELVDKGLVL